MAVRGLGCPAAFILTAGQCGDAPQGEALIEALCADIVIADTAYDSDRIRSAIADKGALAVIPGNPSPAKKNIRSTSIFTLGDILSSVAFQSSSTSGA